jgi:hypothetical protein
VSGSLHTAPTRHDYTARFTAGEAHRAFFGISDVHVIHFQYGFNSIQATGSYSGKVRSGHGEPSAGQGICLERSAAICRIANMREPRTTVMSNQVAQLRVRSAKNLCGPCATHRSVSSAMNMVSTKIVIDSCSGKSRPKQSCPRQSFRHKLELRRRPDRRRRAPHYAAREHGACRHTRPRSVLSVK